MRQFQPPYVEPEGPQHAAAIQAMVNADTRMTKAQRELMHEYGFTIVAGMIDDGAHNVLTMALDLETWRARRQEQWLTTDYVDDKVRGAVLNASRRMPRANRLRSARKARIDLAGSSRTLRANGRS